jgi:acyl-CoA thioesterase II
MSDLLLPGWDGRDIAELLALDETAPGSGTWRNRCGDPNAHGRAYGGQVLAQALMAAARGVPAGRTATAMQFLFLQGTLHDRPIDFQVTPLQDGKRFSARHVRGSQAGERIVLDAQVSFAVPMSAPGHGVAVEPASAAAEDPDQLPRLTDLPSAWAAEIAHTLGYLFEVKEALDFRLPEVQPGLHLDLRAPRLRFWVKLRHRLGDDAHRHAAAFAYLSDWWINYACVGAHVQPLVAQGRRLYVASLNHALWLHRPLRADDWLHFDCSSPAAASGRGLAVARVHDRQGQLVASATQECLMAEAA